MFRVVNEQADNNSNHEQIYEKIVVTIKFETKPKTIIMIYEAEIHNIA